LKPPPFIYDRPDSRAAVDRLLAEHGNEAKILAGGQSLIPILNMRLSAPERLIDINALADEPRAPVHENGVVRFGPLVRHADAEQGAHPLLDEAMQYVGHPAIRSRGTVVGSIAHADPAAEMPAVLLALDGEVRCRSARGTRTVPAREFFVGALECCLLPDEWAEEVTVPAATEGTGYAVEEFARRHGDYAMAGLAATAKASGKGLRDVRLAFFGVGSTPLRAPAAEAALAGGDVDAAVAALARDLDPPDDLQATGATKKHLAGVLLRRVAAELTGGGR
jgi:carbon-monoxide dehydrogenase medium subunit